MEDPSIFTKRIKIYDDLDADSDNVVLINESSNMQLGNGSRIWECVKYIKSIIFKETSKNIHFIMFLGHHFVKIFHQTGP